MIRATYFGFLGEQSGYGVAARRHLLALDRAGVRLAARALRLDREQGVLDALIPAAFPRLRALAARAEDAERAVVHTTPWAFEPVRRRHRGALVGFTVWETEDIPASWAPHLSSVDELWAPSAFAAQALERATGRAVRTVPHPLRRRRRRREAFPGIDDGTFVFLSVLEWQDRKNPDGLLRAFARAFAGRRDVALVLKVGLRLARDGERVLRELRALLPAGAPEVVVIFERLGAVAMRRLFDRADAYASLHRAEGFGLGMAEAMAGGVPVVATGYSGNLEFMDDSSALLVPFRLVRSHEKLVKTGFFGPWTSWAEPDQEAAVEQLRACVDRPAEAQRAAERGQELVRRHLSFERVGELMREGLGSLGRQAQAPSG